MPSVKSNFSTLNLEINRPCHIEHAIQCKTAYMYFIIMKFFVNTDAVLLQSLKIWVKPGQPMKTIVGTRLTRIPGMSDLDTFKPFSSNFQYFSSPVLVYNRDYCPVEPSKHHFINLFSHAFSIANNRHLRIRLPT